MAGLIANLLSLEFSRATYQFNFESQNLVEKKNHAVIRESPLHVAITHSIRKIPIMGTVEIANLNPFSWTSPE